MTTARLGLALVTVAVAMVVLLVSRVGNPLTLSARGIPSGFVAPSSNIPDILGRRAWPAARRAPENLSPDFRLGTLGATAIGEVGGVAGGAPASGLDPASGNTPYDGRFTFVRLRYTPRQTGWGGGGGYFGGINFQWDHDYPRADRNFTQMIDELTGVRATTEGSNILSVGDPDLFKYPLAYLVEPGFLTLTDAEADNLGAYLQKGGFLIFDDFSLLPALRNLMHMLDRILPGGVLVQLTAQHPIFHSFFDIESLDFRHPLQGYPSVFYGIYEDNDPNKRLLLVANYNNDIGESWEYSGTDFIPIEISNVAYKLGVNYVMYSMTH